MKRLTGGLMTLANSVKVTVVQGRAEFASAHELTVTKTDGFTLSIKFENAIIAVGPIRLPFLPDDPRIMTSYWSPVARRFSKNLLVIGGGIIGMELGTVYDALGAKVSVVELTENILPELIKI